MSEFSHTVSYFLHIACTQGVDHNTASNLSPDWHEHM